MMEKVKVTINRSDVSDYEEAGRKLNFGTVKVLFIGDKAYAVIAAACMEDICKICFMAGYASGANKSLKTIRNYFV